MPEIFQTKLIGLNISANSKNILDNELQDMKNLQINRFGELVRRKGLRIVNTPQLINEDDRGFPIFNQNSRIRYRQIYTIGKEYLDVFAVDNKVYLYDEDSNKFTLLYEAPGEALVDIDAYLGYILVTSHDSNLHILKKFDRGVYLLNKSSDEIIKSTGTISSTIINFEEEDRLTETGIQDFDLDQTNVYTFALTNTGAIGVLSVTPSGQEISNVSIVSATHNFNNDTTIKVGYEHVNEIGFTNKDTRTDGILSITEDPVITDEDVGNFTDGKKSGSIAISRYEKIKVTRNNARGCYSGLVISWGNTGISSGRFITDNGVPYNHTGAPSGFHDITFSFTVDYYGTSYNYDSWKGKSIIIADQITVRKYKSGVLGWSFVGDAVVSNVIYYYSNRTDLTWGNGVFPGAAGRTEILAYVPNNYSGAVIINNFGSGNIPCYFDGTNRYKYFINAESNNRYTIASINSDGTVNYASRAMSGYNVNISKAYRLSSSDFNLSTIETTTSSTDTTGGEIDISDSNIGSFGSPITLFTTKFFIENFTVNTVNSDYTGFRLLEDIGYAEGTDIYFLRDTQTKTVNLWAYKVFYKVESILNPNPQKVYLDESNLVFTKTNVYVDQSEFSPLVNHFKFDITFANDAVSNGTDDLTEDYVIQFAATNLDTFTIKGFLKDNLDLSETLMTFAVDQTTAYGYAKTSVHWSYIKDASNEMLITFKRELDKLKVISIAFSPDHFSGTFKFLRSFTCFNGNQYVALVTDGGIFIAEYIEGEKIINIIDSATTSDNAIFGLINDCTFLSSGEKTDIYMVQDDATNTTFKITLKDIEINLEVGAQRSTPKFLLDSAGDIQIDKDIASSGNELEYYALESTDYPSKIAFIEDDTGSIKLIVDDTTTAPDALAKTLEWQYLGVAPTTIDKIISDQLISQTKQIKPISTPVKPTLTTTALTDATCSYSVANPTIVTSTGHGLKNGQTIEVTDNSSQLAGGSGDYVVTVINANSFSIPTDGGTGGDLDYDSAVEDLTGKYIYFFVAQEFDASSNLLYESYASDFSIVKRVTAETILINKLSDNYVQNNLETSSVNLKVYRLKIDSYEQQYRTTDFFEIFSSISLSETATGSLQWNLTSAGGADGGATDTISDAVSANEDKYRGYTDFYPRCKYVEIFGNVVYLANDRKYSNNIYFSDLLDPTTWQPQKVLEAGAFTNDPITGIITHDGLYVFTRDEVQVITGIGTSISKQILTKEIGCVDDRTLAIVGGVILFLSEKGIYFIKGYRYAPIDGPVSNITQQLTFSQNVVAYYDNANLEYRIIYDNNKTLIFNTIFSGFEPGEPKIWYKYEYPYDRILFGFTRENRINDLSENVFIVLNKLVQSGELENSNIAYRLLVEDKYQNDDFIRVGESQSIDLYLRTKRFDMNNGYNMKIFQRIRIDTIDSHTVNAYISINGGEYIQMVQQRKREYFNNVPYIWHRFNELLGNKVVNYGTASGFSIGYNLRKNIDGKIDRTFRFEKDRDGYIIIPDLPVMLNSTICFWFNADQRNDNTAGDTTMYVLSDSKIVPSNFTGYISSDFPQAEDANDIETITIPVQDASGDSKLLIGDNEWRNLAGAGTGKTWTGQDVGTTRGTVKLTPISGNWDTTNFLSSSSDGLYSYIVPTTTSIIQTIFDPTSGSLGKELYPFYTAMAGGITGTYVNADTVIRNKVSETELDYGSATTNIGLAYRVDSEGYSHILKSIRYSVLPGPVYKISHSLGTNISGVWTETSIVTALTTTIQSADMALDNERNHHVIYVDNSDNLVYVNDVTGSFSSPVTVDTSVSAESARIGVDSIGYAHVSYTKGGNILYKNNSSGSFGTAITIGAGNTSRLVIDSGNVIHIIYRDATNLIVKYTKSTGTFTTITDVYTHPVSLTALEFNIDGNGYVYIFTVDNNADLYLSQNTSGSFTTTKILENTDYTPNLVIGEIVRPMFDNNGYWHIVIKESSMICEVTNKTGIVVLDRGIIVEGTVPSGVESNVALGMDLNSRRMFITAEGFSGTPTPVEDVVIVEEEEAELFVGDKIEIISSGSKYNTLVYKITRASENPVFGAGTIKYYYVHDAWITALVGTNSDIVIGTDGSVYKGSVAQENLINNGEGEAGELGFTTPGGIAIKVNTENAQGTYNGLANVFMEDSSNQYYLNGGTFVLNEWHHVALSIDSTNLEAKLYIDGIEVDTVTLTAVFPLFSTKRNIYLGKNPIIDGFEFLGKLDDFRIYNTVLTENNINDIYDWGNQEIEHEQKIYIPPKGYYTGRDASFKFESDDYMNIRSLVVEYKNKMIDY